MPERAAVARSRPPLDVLVTGSRAERSTGRIHVHQAEPGRAWQSLAVDPRRALGWRSAGGLSRVGLVSMNSRPGSGVSAVRLAALVLAPYWGSERPLNCGLAIAPARAVTARANACSCWRRVLSSSTATFCVKLPFSFRSTPSPGSLLFSTANCSRSSLTTAPTPALSTCDFGDWIDISPPLALRYLPCCCL